MIEYSPFDVDIKTIEFNKINASKISEAGISSDTLKIAVFSDVHENYDDMSDAIQSINRQPGINFIFSAGDITSSGLIKEFEWYYEVAKTSLDPIISCIGVHDCWGNGITIFERMFGPTDMSFTLGNYKFILFNNIIWEVNQNSPRYEWLEDQLSEPGYINIMMHHVPPKAGEIGDLHRMIYNQIVDSTNTNLIIQGHFHKFEDYYHNGIRSINADAVDHREYLIVSLINKQVFIKRINF
jgi:predicted phosphodiesterase